MINDFESTLPLYVFKTDRDPDFLVGPRESWCFMEDSSRFQRMGAAFLEELQGYFPEAGYPYLALLNDVILDTPDLCFLRPDSVRLGGLRGGLDHWSYDASTPQGLARMIDEDLSRPFSDFLHANPISHIVDFYENPVFDSAYELLAKDYDVVVIDI